MKSVLPKLRLRRNEDKRIRRGHLWVFSNEVDTAATPLSSFEPGAAAVLEDSRGHAIGVCYVNPASLIAARLLSSDPQEIFDRGFFVRRLQRAIDLRQRLFAKPYYRMVYGESDGLPGLVVDRFDSVLVVQIGTVGMEIRREMLLDALDRVAAPSAIVVKNSAAARELEGLSTDSAEVVHGALPEMVGVEEGDLCCAVDVLHGQKTGWFFDHRDNRAQAARLTRGLRVLDLFCYAGAWGLAALRAGAREVFAVDSSAGALALARDNAERNGVAARFYSVEADVFEHLKHLRDAGESFDAVLLDPPALIKRKKDYEPGLEAYRRLNRLALQVLAPNGLLVSASCSYHLPREKLVDVLRGVAVAERRDLLVIGQGGQGADHPVHPAIIETEYLKSVFCAVGDRS